MGVINSRKRQVRSNTLLEFGQREAVSRRDTQVVNCGEAIADDIVCNEAITVSLSYKCGGVGM